MVLVHSGLCGEIFVFVPWPLEDAGSCSCLHCLLFLSEVACLINHLIPARKKSCLSVNVNFGFKKASTAETDVLLSGELARRPRADRSLGRGAGVRPANTGKLLRLPLRFAGRSSALLSSRTVLRWRLWLIQGKSQSSPGPVLLAQPKVLPSRRSPSFGGSLLSPLPFSYLL